ncbi:hypothetical protein JYT28_00180 [Desulfobulbus sp. AH-315-M07]|nr:hypothetical protein [Desulfobulbus sp. AH-315-M07]
MNNLECVTFGKVTSPEGISVEYYDGYVTTADMKSAIEALNGGQYAVTCIENL